MVTYKRISEVLGFPSSFTFGSEKLKSLSHITVRYKPKPETSLDLIQGSEVINETSITITRVLPALTNLSFRPDRVCDCTHALQNNLFLIVLWVLKSQKSDF